MLCCAVLCCATIWYDTIRYDTIRSDVGCESVSQSVSQSSRCSLCYPARRSSKARKQGEARDRIEWKRSDRIGSDRIRSDQMWLTFMHDGMYGAEYVPFHLRTYACSWERGETFTRCLPPTTLRTTNLRKNERKIGRQTEKQELIETSFWIRTYANLIGQTRRIRRKSAGFHQIKFSSSSIT